MFSWDKGAINVYAPSTLSWVMIMASLMGGFWP